MTSSGRSEISGRTGSRPPRPQWKHFTMKVSPEAAGYAPARAMASSALLRVRIAGGRPTRGGRGTRGNVIRGGLASGPGAAPPGRSGADVGGSPRQAGHSTSCRARERRVRGGTKPRRAHRKQRTATRPRGGGGLAGRPSAGRRFGRTPTVRVVEETERATVREPRRDTGVHWRQVEAPAPGPGSTALPH